MIEFGNKWKVFTSHKIKNIIFILKNIKSYVKIIYNIYERKVAIKRPTSFNSYMCKKYEKMVNNKFILFYFNIMWKKLVYEQYKK